MKEGGRKRNKDTQGETRSESVRERWKREREGRQRQREESWSKRHTSVHFHYKHVVTPLINSVSIPGSRPKMTLGAFPAW